MPSDSHDNELTQHGNRKEVLLRVNDPSDNQWGILLTTLANWGYIMICPLCPAHAWEMAKV